MPYVFGNNLHLLCTVFGNTALQAPAIPGVTSDIDQQARGATVYRGADEIFGSVPPTVVTNTGTICNGTAFTITPVGNAASYLVSGGSLVVTPTINSTYTITAIAANGCQSVVISTVAVTPSPTVTVNSGLMCEGGSFTIVPAGALNYTISGGNTVVSPLTNTDYTVTGEDANGCQDEAISSVTVNPLPTIAVNSGSVCIGSSFTMQPSGALNYTYSSGNNIVSPAINTDYTITGVDAYGCENQAVSSVTVMSLPVVTVNSGAICIGESFTIVPSGAVNYTYSGGNNVVTPTSDASFTVTGEDANGCENIAVSSVTVYILPVINVNSGEICMGESFTIAPTGAVNYTYSSGNNVVSPSSNTTYVVTGADANGCENTAQSSVTVNPLPVVSVTATPLSVCVNGATVALNGTPNGGVFSGVNVSGNVFIPASSGTFAPVYSFTDTTTGCSNSEMASIVVELCTGINGTAQLTGLDVYPNPNTGEFTVELKNGLSKNIIVTDLNGKSVYAYEGSDDHVKIDMSTHASGVYLVKVQSNTSTSIIRIVKQ